MLRCLQVATGMRSDILNNRIIFAPTRKCRIFNILLRLRAVGSGESGGRGDRPIDFGSSVNYIPTRGLYYAHYIISPPPWIFRPSYGHAAEAGRQAATAACIERAIRPSPHETDRIQGHGNEISWFNFEQFCVIKDSSYP